MPLVGRTAELELLRASLDEALNGRTRVVVLTGEPGIGKTRLAEVVSAEAAERGFRVVWGRYWESGGAPAFWPWVQILRALVRNATPDMLAGQVGGGTYLAQLLGEETELFVPSDQARFALFDSVSGFLTTMAAFTPLLLLLEDLHAADAPTLMLLRFLARQPGDARLLLVGTYRNVDARPVRETTEVLADLQRDSTTLVLQGLDHRDIGTLVQHALGSPPDAAVVAALYEATGGNPLFLEGVVRELARGDGGRPPRVEGLGIPDGIRVAIRRRISALSDDARRAVSVAALIGREFTLLFVAPICGLSVPQLLDAIREAVDAGFLVEMPGEIGRYSFSHGLVRDTLADGVTAS